MAIYRFRLADDNRPANGSLSLQGISGSGDLFVALDWEPQGGVVSFGNTFKLPQEFVPTSGTTLYKLNQTGTVNIYDVQEATLAAAGTAFSSEEYQSTVNPTRSKLISDRGWYINSTGAGVAPSQVTFMTQEYTSETVLYAFGHADAEVCGTMLYFGNGTDISAAHGLATGTRWSLPTSLETGDNIAEMVFVDGVQVQGDRYVWGEDYATGLGGVVSVLPATAYTDAASAATGTVSVVSTTGISAVPGWVRVVSPMKDYGLTRMDDGTVEIQFFTPVDVGTKTLFFAVFEHAAEPNIAVRDVEPFVDYDGDHGFWVTYKNLPKGNTVMNYHIF